MQATRAADAAPAPLGDDVSHDTARFRHVLGHFPSGVTVIAGIDEGHPVGFACQSFSSVSLHPPLVAFCAGQESRSWPRIRRAGRFCANVLAEDQEELSRAFSVSGRRKFDGWAWSRSPGGSPILDGVVAWVDCRIEDVCRAGDHSIVVGRVEHLEVARAAGPLVFYRGGYGRFEP